MSTIQKRKLDNTDIREVQVGNRKWWTDNTMSYDWKDKVRLERFSAPWYDEIDRRFIHSARLFAHEHDPFDRIIPFDSLKGKAVLEIGCGMGLHSQLLSQAGAKLTSIDISDVSIEATSRRLALHGLSAEVRRMDACNLEFPDNTFDFVWSWGVIHHSARTAVIIKEIARVLRPGGETRIMVYNLNGMWAYLTILRDYVFGFWRGRTIDECLWRRSDGFMARYYSRDVLGDLMLAFFSSVELDTFGQDADGLPLPRRARRLLMPFMSKEKLAIRANGRGFFLFAIATK